MGMEMLPGKFHRHAWLGMGGQGVRVGRVTGSNPRWNPFLEVLLSNERG